MASPVADSYSAASGVTLYGGRAAAAAAAFSAVAGATDFKSWGMANIPYAGTFLGTDAIGAMIDAYGDMIPDYVAKGWWLYNGGHGDGTCNAVVFLSWVTWQYTLYGQPTPPSKYPPLYANPPTNGSRHMTYPSGLSGEFALMVANTGIKCPGYFLSGLTGVDAPYDTAFARATTHMYASAAVRNGVIHMFYAGYAEFDTINKVWRDVRSTQIGQQLLALPPRYTLFGASEVQQGTHTIYDAVTDRMFITLSPGDASEGYRSDIAVFNPTTRQVEAVYESVESSTSYGLIGSAMNLVVVGRNIYGFTKLNAGFSAPQVMHQGFIFNMDTQTFKKFVLNGDPAASTVPYTTNQETIPSFYDGVAIRRWNYAPTQINMLYSVNLTPLSGSGTPADPFVLDQTGRTITGAVPADDDVRLIYRRLVWVPEDNCAYVTPRATKAPIKLTLR